MKTLHLLRHAKSRRDDPKLDDHERPLSPRGIEDGMAVAEHCAKAGVQPDLILCSSSVRTRATLALMLPYLPVAQILVERGLYLAGADELLQRVRAIDDACKSALLIGHNDGIHDFARSLPGDAGDAELRIRLGSKFPTSALASVRFDVTGWRQLAPGRGTLMGYITPKDLHC
jgi:phosphohistidine phosphatase